jgi:hypothetical protein
MKIFFLMIASSLVMASPVLAREQSILARVTVYWASGGGGSDVYTRAHKCSTGARLRAGHCAVDPKKIAYGSKVVFPDATCVAVDTGRDVVNRKAARRCGRNASERSALVIDRFFETKREAKRWAKAHPQFMTVRVLAPSEELAESRKTRYIAKQTAPLSPVVRLVRIARPDQFVLAKNLKSADFVNRRNKLASTNVNPVSDILPHRF